MNKIYFRRAGKVAVATESQDLYTNFGAVAALDANLRKLGYALDGELAMALIHEDTHEIAKLHDELIAEAKEIKGVRNYRPMYPNLPRQVMEADAGELYINAIMHYFGAAVGLRIMPVYDELKRPELDFDESKVTFIRLGSEDDFVLLIRNLLHSKSSFSETDKADIKSLVGSTELVRALAGHFDLPNRENKAFVASQVMHLVDLFRFDTATDVLRLAVAMSDGDVSLAEKTQFKNFKRSERRMLLGSLKQIKDPQEDMLRNASAWKRLGERLHPGEFGMAEVFKAVRENGSVESFNARVEKALADGDPLGAARMLRARPGEFARRLDKVLRTNATFGVQQNILAIFGQVADKASPTVLIQARNAFLNRDNSVRVFFPKGRVGKMQSILDERGSIPDHIVDMAIVTIDSALFRAFSDREDLGGSWVDPALKKIAVPFGQRSASKSVKTLGRGSRLAFASDTNIVRFFIWWKDVDTAWNGHTDIDLSAVMFNDKFNYVDAITYYNLREQGAVHSGDITSAPNGASEFIDIDVDTLRNRGVRYVAMTLHSYSGQDFAELPECFAGFMERSDFDSGEVYDPRTVTNKVDLTAKSRGATPFIFDLETGEAIWVDLSMQISHAASNVNTTKGQITSLVEAMTTLTPPNMYDLFSAHAAARGGIVDKEKAKTKFGFDGDITPFDTELILDKFL